MIRRTIRACVAAGALVAAAAAGAYSVAPLRLLLEPVGPGANGRVEIRNTEAKPVTISIAAHAVAVSDTGEMTESAADEDLLLFPPQMILQPGQSQAVQVRYMGEPTLDRARLYAARIAQEPVDMQTGQEAQLKMGINFIAAVLVQPKNATPALSVAGFRPQAGGAGVAVDLRNDGNGAARIPALAWQVTGPGGAALTVSGPATGYGDASFLLPGGRRTVIVPVAGGAEGVTAVAVSAAR